MTKLTRRQFLIGAAGLAAGVIGVSGAARAWRTLTPPPGDARPAFIFVDHYNLRYIESKIDTSWRQVEAVKRNLNEAAARGADTYILFARELQEALLCYDFELPGVGLLSQVYPPGSKARVRAEGLRACLAEVLRHAETRGIDVVLHSNQLEFDPPVYELIRDRVIGTTGTPICPGREDTWRVYRGRLTELLRLFPSLAGVQVTADESEVTVLDCQCDYCRHLDPVARVDRLTHETAAACGARETLMRTWQSLPDLEAYGVERMTANLPPNVTLSLKSTRGDFMIDAPFDTVLIGAGDPRRQIVEFDAWGEYEGKNYIPCYMGDIHASHVKACAERGIRRYSVRVNRNSDVNDLFERPWAGLVNLHGLMAAAANPSANPDDTLRGFIAQWFPPADQSAAFAFYKATPDFMRAVYYAQGQYLGHHGRLLRSREMTEEVYQGARHLFPTAAAFDQHRARIEAAYLALRGHIDSLRDISPTWRDEMERGAAALRFVGLGLADMLQVVSDSADAGARARLLANETAWRASDQASYDYLRGRMLREVLEAP